MGSIEIVKFFVIIRNISVRNSSAAIRLNVCFTKLSLSIMYIGRYPQNYYTYGEKICYIFQTRSKTRQDRQNYI